MSDKPVGIFGGTFDPIHYGHLRLAEEMLELAGLAELRFIPAGNPPHREAPDVAAIHRSAMVGLAIAGRPEFLLDTREVERPGRCYSADTLRELRTELGAERSLCLLMGADAFLQLHTWHEWQTLSTLAHIVVGYRPGFRLEERIPAAPSILQHEYRQRIAEVAALKQAPAGKIVELAIPQLEISATDIRQRVASGRSIRYLLPDTVADYIHQHHLYGSC